MHLAPDKDLTLRGPQTSGLLGSASWEDVELCLGTKLGLQRNVLQSLSSLDAEGKTVTDKIRGNSTLKFRNEQGGRLVGRNLERFPAGTRERDGHVAISRATACI